MRSVETDTFEAAVTRRSDFLKEVEIGEIDPNADQHARIVVDRRGYFGAASATFFMSASPFSNWPPTILSMFMKRWSALAR